LPERLQLTTSTLSPNQSVAFPEPLTEAECTDAASWITPRLGIEKENRFFKPSGEHYHLLSELVQAVTRVLQFLFMNNNEVPYIYAHRRDYLLQSEIKPGRAELLNLDDLWQIYSLGLKYRSLCMRRKVLRKSYEKLGVSDEYFEKHLLVNMDAVEMVVDATQWLGMKYKEKKGDDMEFAFHDDEPSQTESKTHKKPNRSTAYDLAKKSIVSKVAEVRGILHTFAYKEVMWIGTRALESNHMKSSRTSWLQVTASIS
jgi:transcription elongation factor SPT6